MTQVTPNEFVSALNEMLLNTNADFLDEISKEKSKVQKMILKLKLLHKNVRTLVDGDLMEPLCEAYEIEIPEVDYAFSSAFWKETDRLIKKEILKLENKIGQIEVLLG